MKGRFIRRLHSHKYRIYEESLYSKGKWVKTLYTVKKRYLVFGISLWLYLSDRQFNRFEFSTRAEAHSAIGKLEKGRQVTGWTRIMIDQERYDH